MNALRLMALAALAVTIAGCGARSGTVEHVKTAPVRGSVQYQGKPHPGIRVTFHPRSSMGKLSYTPTGETDAEGRFTLNAGAEGNGAPPGEYAVTFEWPIVVTDHANSGIEQEVDRLKGKYGIPAESGFIIKVVNGDNVLEPFLLD